MKLEPYKFYKEDNTYDTFIYYMSTDDESVYHVMRINKKLKYVLKTKVKSDSHL